MVTTGVYGLANGENGKLYVGSAGNVEVRFRKHLGQLRRGTHCNAHLQRAFRVAPGNWVFCVLEVCDHSELASREQYWLDVLQSYDQRNGYNIMRRCYESPLRGRDAWNKGMNTGQVPWNYGQHMSVESRAKMRDAKLGTHRSDGTKDKISRSMIRLVGADGRNLEWQRRLHGGMLGKHHSDETRRKLRAARVVQGNPLANPVTLQKKVETGRRNRIQRLRFALIALLDERRVRCAA